MVLAQKALVYANIASMIAPRKTLAMANLYMYLPKASCCAGSSLFVCTGEADEVDIPGCDLLSWSSSRYVCSVYVQSVSSAATSACLCRLHACTITK